MGSHAIVLKSGLRSNSVQRIQVLLGRLAVSQGIGALARKYLTRRQDEGHEGPRRKAVGRLARNGFRRCRGKTASGVDGVPGRPRRVLALALGGVRLARAYFSVAFVLCTD